MTVVWFVILLLILSTLAYHRASLIVTFISVVVFMSFLTIAQKSNVLGSVFYWTILLNICLPLLISKCRQRLISKPLLLKYQQKMPSISRTEQEALNAGTVGWEGDLFSGNPDINQLLSNHPLQLTPEEKAFIAGPVEILCTMLDDWDITHRRADLPPVVWEFLKKEGFFGLLIPTAYGGKGFSYYACSQIQIKIQARSATAGTIVSVPNSLGPAELLLHYGTEEQKSYYLPRLAKGEEIPCFALTSPDAGSDATAMSDIGIVCRGDFQGKDILGIRLHWNKRYITLAPVATVIGLAFKLYDPNHLLGEPEEIGITCALIPRNTPGITIGRRHLPLNIPFQNGPIQGKDVFIPLDWIIGGRSQAGQGWRMLMECLAGGRGVSLPAAATSAAKAAVLSTGAYARIRQQFKQAIVQFEGVGEALATMAGHLYLMEAARHFILSALDRGEKPAVASAIIKYHATEKARLIGNHAMDIQGGKGIILGPKNVIARHYEAIPIAITVEGANILTRNMIIFGQGVTRCHPYVLAEYQAAHEKDSTQGLIAFDKAFFSHVGFIISNIFRTCILGLTAARIIQTPESRLKGYFQKIKRFSAVFALLTDISMLVYGKHLKSKESVSARLGDILSHLYLLSAVLQRYYQEGEPEESMPLLHWIGDTCFYEIQARIDELLQNFPLPILPTLLKFLIFPWGQQFKKPTVKLSMQVAQLFSTSTETRACLTAGLFLTATADNFYADIEDALTKVMAAEPGEKIVRKAVQAGLISGYTFKEQLKQAVEKNILNEEHYQCILAAEQARQHIIAVDDFSPAELART